MAIQEERQKLAVVDVVRIGDKLVLPDSMSYEEGIEQLKVLAAQDAEVIEKHFPFSTSPFEGAVALEKSIKNLFGFAILEGQDNWLFGKGKPMYVSAEVGVRQRKDVPWGKFSLPGTKGEVVLSTQVHPTEQGAEFVVTVQMKRKWEGQVTKLVAEINRVLASEPLYRGQALRMKFRDSDGDPLHWIEPKFMDLDAFDPSQVIYTKELERSIEINLMTLLKYGREVREAGAPMKRGLLFAGEYGTGKTLLALKAAIVAKANGWTFVYVQDASEMPDAVRFAQKNTPAVVFVEDVDRVTSGDRTQDIDSILNAVDGIDSKSHEVILIATTNEVHNIHPAMKRAGRFDVILEVMPPDAEAVQRLIRAYSQTKAAGRTVELLDPTADLTVVGEKLKGRIPAIIREVVERAKLATIARTGRSVLEGQMSAADLEDASDSMLNQIKISTARVEVPVIPEPIQRLALGVIAAAEHLSGRKSPELINY